MQSSRNHWSKNENALFTTLDEAAKRNKRTKNESQNENAEQPTDAKETQPTLYGFRGVYVFDRLSRDLWPSLCALDGSRESHFGSL